MRVGLFIPCYIDQFYPEVAISTLELLEKLDFHVVFPEKQACCGQPMANSGFSEYAEATELNFKQAFSDVDAIVGPTASCILHIKDHSLLAKEEKYHHSVFELAEFIHKYGNYCRFKGEFPHRVGLHQGCHGLRGLHLGSSSELRVNSFSIIKEITSSIRELEWVELTRPDECCGFGGTFAVNEEAVSVAMGSDRVEDHVSSGAEWITSTDMSCMMHLEGVAKRQKRPVKFIHLAELLNRTIQ